MVWAGAVKQIFKIFCDEWNPKGVRLLMNHRSAPRLVALQQEMYASLKEKATEVCASGNWAEDDGNIALFIADNEQLEAAAVSKDILFVFSASKSRRTTLRRLLRSWRNTVYGRALKLAIRILSKNQ